MPGKRIRDMSAFIMLWSMLSTYLIYAIDPSPLKETVSAIKGLGFTTLLRKVSITSEGSATSTFSRPVLLCYPIDLMVMPVRDANDFLNGASHVQLFQQKSRSGIVYHTLTFSRQKGASPSQNEPPNNAAFTIQDDIGGRSIAIRRTPPEEFTPCAAPDLLVAAPAPNALVLSTLDPA